MKRLSVRAGSACAAGLLMALTPVSAVTANRPDDAARSGRAPSYDDYVALGDSYTAGPLIPFIRLDPPGCVRSTNNYPARLASYLDVDSYVDVSCSGARSKHLRTPQHTPLGTNPPQLDALGPHTDLVTLGIGGNDFGLFGSLLDKCPELAEHHPNGAPCKKWFNRSGTDVKKRDARRIGAHVARDLQEIRDRAPGAEIAVVGYLRILPVDGSYCRRIVPFARGDYRWANSVERTLNKSLRRAAHEQGAGWVRMYPVSRGHTACDGKRAWVNGQHTDLTRAASYHPFGSGMRGIARQAYREITGHGPPATRVRGYSGRTLSPKELRTFSPLMRALTTGHP